MIALLLSLGLAHAAPEDIGAPRIGDAAIGPDPDGESLVDTWGELRLIASLPPDVRLDTDGNRLGQGFVLDSRFRGGLWIGNRKVRGVIEGDLLDGQIAGDPWDVPGDEDERGRDRIGPSGADDFDLRKAMVAARLGPVGLQAGVMTSHWGLGMVANDGNRDPVFGRNDFGDRVIRVRLATRPFQKGELPLSFLLAGDRVIEDEIGRWRPFAPEDERGVKAWQGIASTLWEPEKGATVGLYGVYRYQLEADGERRTDAGVIDAYTDWTGKVSGAQLRLAAEGATIFGRTDRVLTYNERDKLKVRSFGLTGLAELEKADFPLRGILRAGYASGDGVADDDTTHDFSFDRDFDAGMVAHDELRGAIDAAAYDQVGRPEHSGGAPEGAEVLVAEGAFAHASFLQPVLGIRPMDWLDVKLGATLHAATGPIAHPFTTTRNGGVPANHLGVPTDGYWMGTELNWSVLLGDVVLGPEKLGAKPALLLQGGHFVAGENYGGELVSLVTATGRLRW